MNLDNGSSKARSKGYTCPQCGKACKACCPICKNPLCETCGNCHTRSCPCCRCKPKPPPPSPPPEPPCCLPKSALQVQLWNWGGESIIPHLSPVLFDKEKFKMGGKIHFNPERKLIVIGEKGNYEINWEIPIDATDDTEEVTLHLMINRHIVHSSYLPNPFGHIYGSAMVHLKEERNIVYLLNASECSIRVPHFAYLSIKELP